MEDPDMDVVFENAEKLTEESPKKQDDNVCNFHFLFANVNIHSFIVRVKIWK